MNLSPWFHAADLINAVRRLALRDGSWIEPFLELIYLLFDGRFLQLVLRNSGATELRRESRPHYSASRSCQELV